MKKILNKIVMNILILTILLVCCIFSVYVVFFPQTITYADTEYSENIRNEKSSIAHDEELKENSQKTLDCVFNNQVKTTKGLYPNYQTDIDFKLDEVSVILTEKSSKEGFDENIFLNIQNIERIEGKETPTEADLNNNLYRQILTIKLKHGGEENVFTAITELQNLEEVLVAEPLYEFTPCDDYVPNDPFYTQGEQWGLNEIYGIHAAKAWDIYNDNRILDTVKIGIFENGIQSDHPDLTVGNGNIESDSAGSEHGTHVAGIIGANINNNIGIAGIAPVEIYLLDRSNFVESLNWAEQNGINIINASFYFSRPKLDDEGNVVSEAIYTATHAAAIENFNGLFIASAGNQNINNDLHPQYPACYDSENIIAVGSINSDGNKRDFSNYGSSTVDIFAPGGNILSTLPSDTYGYKSGTSMAAPHVTGAAALMMSINPNLEVEEIKEKIINNDTYISSLSGCCVSGGILNAYNALRSIQLTQEIFKDFGYEGSTYSWKGFVEMDYFIDNEVLSDGTLIVKDTSALYFRVKTLSSKNAYLVTNGEIKFELKNSKGEILQTNICTVKVDLLNNVTLSGNTFSIDTNQLDTGIHTLNMTSKFTRGTWSSESTDSYTIAVNRPVTVMEEFGYLSSWYKWEGNVKLSGEQLYLYEQTSLLTIQGTSEMNFQIGTSFVFNAVKEMTGTITITLKDSAGNIEPINGNNTHTSTVRVGLASNVSITNSTFSISPGDLTADTYTLTLNCRMTRDGTTYTNSAEFSFEKEAFLSLCVAEGSMITLADGSQKAVEDLTGDEELLVWNMFTGEFDSAPILFIDSDPENYYEVINLYFSDGTTVKVISEHAFWDVNLNEYVFLRSDAAQYIGHWFNKQTVDENGNMVYTEVQLTNVVVQQEYTSAWSPVTYGHLCYYVNGMLSMPGATTGLINIFEVDPDTMTIDQEAYLEDIEEYGLFTYEEFNALCPIPEAVFNAFGGQYLKVSLGKGLITWEELENLISRYSEFWN